MSGVNKVLIVGRLGKDPEIKHLQDGGQIVNASIATSESWKDKQTGEKQEKTEWHRVVFFNRLAEIAGQYLAKGSLVYLEGKLQTRKWTDQSGQDRYTTEIVAGNMQMLGSNGNASNEVGAFQKPTQQQSAKAVPTGIALPPASVVSSGFDDLPF